MSDTLGQDIRYSLRQLASTPGSTLIIVVTLGVVLAANASLFSVLNATLLEPLPFFQPERVAFLLHRYNDMVGSGTAPLLVDYRRELASFESVSASYPWNANLTGDGDPERLQGLLVSADFFSTLGVESWRGRTFVAEEELPGRGRVVAISHGLWQRRFGGDERAVGSRLELNGNAYQVVGIMPPGFHWGRGWRRERQADVWAPFELTAERTADSERGSEYLDIHARLAPGTSFVQAQAELDGLRLALRSRFPDRYTEASGWRAEVVSVHGIRVRSIRPALIFVFCAAAALLLIAATNVAGLRLARTSGRRRELLVRAALGASRGRLMRLMLTETAVLAAASAALGLIVARAVVVWLEQIVAPVDVPRAQPIELDANVLVFTLIATLATTLVCGLVPAWLGSPKGSPSISSTAGKVVGGGRAHPWTQRILVVTQTGLALALLVGAGLMVRSFTALQQVSPGYRKDGVLIARISLPASRYAERATRRHFMDRLLARVDASAAVESIAAISSLPLSGDGNSNSFDIEGVEIESGKPQPHGESWSASTTYFRTMEIPLLSGRGFDERDTADSAGVVVINQTLADEYFAGTDPLGKRIDFEGDGAERQWREIIGVVGDVHDRGLDEMPRAQMYTSYTQRPFRQMSLVVQSTIEPVDLLRELKGAVASLDAELPLFEVSTIERLVARDSRDRRVAAWLLALFSGTALALAALGLYGLLSYLVREKTSEIGLRVALGAGAFDLVRSILGDGARLVAVGVTLGIGLALVGTRLLRSFLFGVAPVDALTYAVVTVVLTCVALVACALPAWKATRIDPTVALRED